MPGLLALVLTGLSGFFAPAPAAQGFQGEMKERFKLALKASVVGADIKSAPSRILLLQHLERTHNYDFFTPRLIRDALAEEPSLAAALRQQRPMGLRAIKPLEKDFSITKPGISAKGATLPDEILFLAAADRIIPQCRDDETDYNVRFARSIANQQWGKDKETWPYALLMRMQLFGCLPKKDFAALTQRFVPAMERKARLTPLSQSSFDALYLLAMTQRMDGVPADVWLHFARAQDPGGAWMSESQGNPSRHAVMGAVILAAMMQKSGIRLSKQDVIEACGQTAPKESRE